MYRVVTQVKIVQIPTADFPQRNKTISFDFVHEMECSDTWRDLTNDGKIIIPKNLYVRDAGNKLISLFGTNVNIGGFSNSNPLFLRGDAITLDWGYKFFDKGKEIFVGTENKSKGTHLFQGFISKVTSKKPIELHFEDNTWKLKQIPALTRTFKPTETLENILKTLLSDYNKANPSYQFTVNALTSTTLGEFRTGSESVGEVMGRLRKNYGFESTFRDNELRCGSTIYIESEANKHVFTFQHDIISDDLDYQRKEDLVLSVVASNKIEELTGKTTKDGHEKTKCSRIEVLVTLANGSDKPIVKVKNKGEDFPQNEGGTRITRNFPGANNIMVLTDLAIGYLRPYYYSGFKGKFTTFGLQFVKMGDNVQLIDPKLPERNGLYKVKGVEYNGGVDGLRQSIELHYKIS